MKVHLVEINQSIHLFFCFLLIPIDLIEYVENERLQSTIWGCVSIFSVFPFSVGLISGLEEIQKWEPFAFLIG